MKWLLLLLSLTASASEAGAQQEVIFGYPTCLAGEAAYRVEPHDAARALTSVHAVTTDGFGARYSGPTGREVRADDLDATTILSDGALAWRTPTTGQVVERCPGLLRVIPDLNLGLERGLRLSAEVGNETGDPGPFRYLDPNLPNVDKIGPDYEGTLAVGPSLTSVRWRDFLPTDPAIAPRIFAALDDRFPKRKGLSASTSLRLGPFTAEAGGVVAEDLPFEETLGREVPTLRRHLGAEVVGSVGWNSYDARIASAWLDRPSWSLLDVPGPDWQETSADIRVSRLEQAMGLSGFARVRPVWASGPGLSDGSVLWGEIGADRLSPYGLPLYGARLSAGPSGIGGGVSVRSRIPAAAGVSFSALARADRRLPEAAPDLPFWVSRGYIGLASDATPLALDGVPRAIESIALNATATRWWTPKPSTDFEFGTTAGLSATLDVEARRGETVLLPDFRLTEDAVAVNGPVRAVVAEGAAAEAEVAAQVSRHRVVYGSAPSVFTRAKVWARGRLSLAGDDAFRAHLDRQPSVRIGASAEHSPDGKLNLRARAEWRSSTRWDGWPEPDLPAALLADLGLDYTLGAFTLALTGRNVLGAPEQTHPLGATLDGRLFARLEVRL